MLAKHQLLNRMPYPSLLSATSRSFAACLLPISPPAAADPCDHQAPLFSIVDNLIEKRLYSCAQVVIRDIISNCFSVPSAVAALDFARSRGLPLDLDTRGVVLSKFVILGERNLAEGFYNAEILGKGIDSGPSVLSTMVICYCKLGKVDEAKRIFQRHMALGYFPSRAACAMLLTELCAKGRNLEAYDHFVECNDARVMMGHQCLTKLIYCLCNVGLLDEALHVFDKMVLSVNSRPTAKLYKTLFYDLCRQERLVEAEQLGWGMESQGYIIDKKMFTLLIHGYCKEKKLKMAMRVFFRMLKLCCEPDNYTYGTLIDGFAKLGMVNKCWVLHDQMLELGMTPDAVTYQILIDLYCRRREVDCAATILDRMIANNIAPNTHCYTPIIDALIKDERFEEVHTLYHGMLDRGVIPDHVLFLKLLKQCPPGTKLHLAFNVLEAIAEKACGVPRSSIKSASRMDLMQLDCILKSVLESNPGMAPVAFAICISALCAVEKVDDALNCLQKMVYLGYQPLLSTYNSLIKCLLHQDRDVEFLFSLMQNQGMRPDLDTYLIVINSHCKQDDLVTAIGVLDEMRENGISPSVSIYDCIIKGLCKAKRIDDAVHMFRRMIEDGIDPDEVLYITMINGCSKNGKAREACKVFDKMVEQGIQPSSYAYTALMYGLVRRNMIKKKYLDRMLKEGFVPNHVFFTSVISQFLKRGELEYSLRLVNLMYASLIERDRLMYIALVSGVSRNITRLTPWHILHMSKKSKKIREYLFSVLQCSVAPQNGSMEVSYTCGREMRYLADRLMQEIRHNGYLPCIYLYNCMIYRFCSEKRMQEAYDHLRLMLSAHVSPNHITFTILINGHIRCNEVDHALFQFKEMISSGCEPDKVTYNALIRGLCDANRLQEALSLSVAMCKRGLIPSQDCYQRLLYSFCVLHSSADAFKIFQEMLFYHYFPSRKMFLRLLRTLFKACEFGKACKVCDSLPERRADQYLRHSGLWSYFTITKT